MKKSSSIKKSEYIQRPVSNSNDKRAIHKTETNLMGKINSIFEDIDPTMKNTNYSMSLKNEDQFNNDYELDKEIEEKYQQIMSEQQKQTESLVQKDGREILNRAKNLIKKKSDVIEKAQYKYQFNGPKENTFVTGIGLYAEKIEPQQEEDDDVEEMPDLNEEEYVKNLIQEYSDALDPLEELRRMIKKTKLDIEDYADDLYTLKSSVSEANIGLREMGKGVNEGVFWDLDSKFLQEMPNGNKKRIFDEADDRLPAIQQKKKTSHVANKSETQTQRRQSSATNQHKQYQDQLKKIQNSSKPQKPSISSKLSDKAQLDGRDKFL